MEYLSPSNTTTVVHERSVSPALVSIATPPMKKSRLKIPTVKNVRYTPAFCGRESGERQTKIFFGWQYAHPNRLYSASSIQLYNSLIL